MMETFGLFQIFHLHKQYFRAHSCACFLLNRGDNFSRVYNESAMAMSQIMPVFNYPKVTETSNLGGATTILFNRNVWEFSFSDIPQIFDIARFIFILLTTWALKESHFSKFAFPYRNAKWLSLFMFIGHCVFLFANSCLYPLPIFPFQLFVFYYWFVAVIYIFSILFSCYKFWKHLIIIYGWYSLFKVYLLVLWITLCDTIILTNILSFTLCSCILYSIREWIASPQNLYVEVLILNMNIFRDRVFRR